MREDHTAFAILRKARDLLMNLHEQVDVNLKKQKPILRVYLQSLAYLTECFKDSSLLELSHYAIILENTNDFKEIAADHQQSSELVEYEFVNEFSQLEIHIVTTTWYFF